MFLSSRSPGANALDSGVSVANFHQLKPCCVRISQLAIREIETATTSRELQGLLQQVLDLIKQAAQENPDALDEKLAEYVFFPLQYIFRRMQEYPVMVIENCVKCLHLLISHGWKTNISAQLVSQIFSLLVFAIDGSPVARRKDEDVPEELKLDALRALAALISIAGKSIGAFSGLTNEDALPALGHGVTVMLDSAVDGISTDIQNEALECIQVLYASSQDRAATASFLPGTISSMAKLLSSANRHKASVLSKSLVVVRVVLTKVLGDISTRSIQVEATIRKEKSDAAAPKQGLLTPEWLRATSAQVKLALSAMMKLRTHASANVRDALDRLCIALLDECHTSLSNCTTLLIETAIILDKGRDAEYLHTDLRALTTIYPELGDTIKTAVFGWMTGLPRVMQHGEDAAKNKAVHNLSKGIELLHGLGIESTMLEDSLSDNLRDGLSSLMPSSKEIEPRSHLQLLDEPGDAKETVTQQAFEPVLIASESQRALRSELGRLMTSIGSSVLGRSLAGNMLYHARESNSRDQVGAFWLCFELIKAAHQSSAETDALLDLSTLSDSSTDLEPIFEDLFSYSAQVIESHAESRPADWRLEAIALEVAAYCAQRMGASFRPHLMDVLFPIVTFLGSENTLLQQHAIVTLNRTATSCGYQSVSELIIQNVDYMVNSVSLRLNSLDISPSSVQVLRMMIRLTGPHLIPYLDDVVDSIFAALENYHGYTMFAEDLFSILTEIVKQASGLDKKLLIDRERTVHDHKKQRKPARGFDQVWEDIETRKARHRGEEEEETSPEQVEGHPTEPWTAQRPAGEGEGEDVEDEAPPPEPEKQPNSPTYQLLLRIAYLTQHYLTSPSPSMRRSLLGLLTNACSILAGDEDSFLPLVNAIWPVVIERLRDPEPFVGIEACRTLVGLCAAAGDFMSTRFITAWDDWLRNWCRKAKKQAESVRMPRPTRQAGKQSAGILIPIRSSNGVEARSVVVTSDTASGGSLGQYASAMKMWEAVTELLTAIVSYVRMDPAMFDDIVDLLRDVLETNSEVREALEVISADAVWLARHEKGRVESSPTPVAEGVKFIDM